MNLLSRSPAPLAFSRARSLGFTFESILLNGLGVFLPSRLRASESFDPELLQLAKNRLISLLKADADRISRGIYPLEVLRPEGFVEHLLRIPRIAFDGLKLSFRRSSGKTREFGSEARTWIGELPRYYQRNFHFQTDGYLSEASAEIYEHQVEVLFLGAADAMRRLLLEPLKSAFPQNPQGEGLRFLELASGTGRSALFLKLAFPKARITLVDLSDPYMKVARKKLSKHSRIDFVTGDATELEFSDQTFDAVCSTFLFHELPLEERKKALKEMVRVTRQGGFVGFVDSIQKHDEPRFAPFLDVFPKNFHEPFYRNYVETPMEPLLAEAGLTAQDPVLGFFSKAILGQKQT